MELIRGMVIMVVGNFLMAFVFAHNNAAWSFVPGMAEQSKVVLIMNASIFTWLGFYLPVDIGVVTWERKSWKLFAIEEPETTNGSAISNLKGAVIKKAITKILNKSQKKPATEVFSSGGVGFLVFVSSKDIRVYCRMRFYDEIK
jgi:hypothetical protein